MKNLIVHPGVLLGFAFLLFGMFPGGGFPFSLSGEEIGRFQASLIGKTTGERIAFWAEKFIDTPYDPDPLGTYVTRAVIVADDQVDCMYLTFRAVELARSRTPEEAVQVALEMRFHDRGILQDGRVANYDGRFEYGEDMIQSAKWGREITGQVGPTIRIKGSRARPFWTILSKAELQRGLGKLKSGDLIFFIKAPGERTVGEAVGHMGIIKLEPGFPGGGVFLIHARGAKNKGGSVQKVLFQDYIAQMPFIGAKITRFD